MKCRSTQMIERDARSFGRIVCPLHSQASERASPSHGPSIAEPPRNGNSTSRTPTRADPLLCCACSCVLDAARPRPWSESITLSSPQVIEPMVPHAPNRYRRPSNVTDPPTPFPHKTPAQPQHHPKQNKNKQWPTTTTRASRGPAPPWRPRWRRRSRRRRGWRTRWRGRCMGRRPRSWGSRCGCEVCGGAGGLHPSTALGWARLTRALKSKHSHRSNRPYSRPSISLGRACARRG